MTKPVEIWTVTNCDDCILCSVDDAEVEYCEYYVKLTVCDFPNCPLRKVNVTFTLGEQSE